MVLPSKARKEAGINSGDIVLVETNGDGRIVLTRLERPKPARPADARLVRRKGRHSVIAGAPKVSLEQVNRILRDEFP
jgi:bifunctional DNA-binding transcriptional regulator/antitoxin component of YhaV-PrlF toxin-antitoxin module